MRLFIIALNFRKLSFTELAALCQRVIDGFTAQSATYTTPVPTVATVTADLAMLTAAIAAHGDRSNHGRTSDFTALKDAANQVKLDLFTMASYAESVTPGDRT